MNFHGLGLTVNGTKIGSGPRTLLSTGVQHVWKTFSLPLPLGTTEVMWTYEKDNDENSDDPVRVGLDRAYLRDIRITNGKCPLMCRSCAAGSIPALTKDSCVPCPVNTFAARGSTTCTPCPNNTVAPIGSAQCVPPEICRGSKYTFTLGSCFESNHTRKITYQQPIGGNCVPTAPPMLFVPCDACPQGARWNAVTRQCVTCPEGQYENTTTGLCLT